MARKRGESARSRSQSHSLTEAEWAIMDVVWREEPCAAGTVQDALEASQGWAYSTVKTTMDRMVAKGLLGTHAIRNLNLFTSQVSRDEARRSELKRCLQRAFDGALAPMIQFLFEQEELSERELQELRSLIRKSLEKK
jgi:BlaI family penicillinase repressor